MFRGFQQSPPKGVPETHHRNTNRGEKLKNKVNAHPYSPTVSEEFTGQRKERQVVRQRNQPEAEWDVDRFIPVCHYCNRPGHIRLYCKFYLGDKRKQASLSTGSKSQGRMHQGYAVHTCNRSIIGNVWYVDSGCSKHMTGNKDFLTNIKMGSSDRVKFADGVESRVLGSGTLNIPGMPPLKKVLYVEGLTSNLISISQLCDEGLDVQFDNKQCIITKDQAEYLVGRRSANECYLVTPTVTCNFVKLTSAEIWHQKLGHTNYINL